MRLRKIKAVNGRLRKPKWHNLKGIQEIEFELLAKYICPQVYTYHSLYKRFKKGTIWQDIYKIALKCDNCNLCKRMFYSHDLVYVEDHGTFEFYLCQECQGAE